MLACIYTILWLYIDKLFSKVPKETDNHGYLEGKEFEQSVAGRYQDNKETFYAMSCSVAFYSRMLHRERMSTSVQ
jgi:hypothetical protein